MPVPTPQGDESEQDFVQRCMSDDAMQEYEQDQRAAICYSTYRERSAHAEHAMLDFTQTSFDTKQPTPEEGESAEDFVSRCMGFEGLQDMDPDQRAAICWDAYRQSVEPPDDGGEGAAATLGVNHIRTRLPDLQHQRAKLVERLEAIVRQEEKLPAGKALPVATQGEFQSIRQKITALDARIGRVKATLDASAAQITLGQGAAPMKQGANGGAYPLWATPRKQPKKGPGLQAARFCIGLMHRRWSGVEKAAEFIMNRFGDDAVAKALNTLVVAEGGALIPQDFLADLIELLRSAVVVRRANPVTVGMPMGNLTIPRLAGGASASYQGELDDIELTHQAFDNVNFVARKLTAMVPVSNDLLRRAPFGVEEIVRDDLVQTIARREDLAFLRGDGADQSPVGFLHHVLPENIITIGAGANLDAVVAALSALKLSLINGLSRMLRPAWFMAPTVIEFIRNQRDSVGGFYYKDEIDRGTLDGIPIFMSQQIPTNLNAGNGSEIYLVDMADAVIADTMEVQIDASDVAAYYGTDGKVVSTFQRDQSLIRVISAHDFNMRHRQSLAVGITSDWKFTGLAGVPGRPWNAGPLNRTWAQAPAAWPADATNADPAPTLYDPATSESEAFAGPLTNRPGGLPRPDQLAAMEERIAALEGGASTQSAAPQSAGAAATQPPGGNNRNRRETDK